MKLQFPIKTIKNNLIFNHHNEVWSYYQLNLFNLFLLNYQDKDLHAFISNNEVGEQSIYVGYKLEPILVEKNNFKINFKCFMEGFTSTVKQAVGLEGRNILYEDLVDYDEQAKEIETFLSKRCEVCPVTSTSIVEILSNLLHVDNREKENGLLNVKGVHYFPFNSNIIEMNNLVDNTEKVYVRYLAVKEINQMEYLLSLVDTNIPHILSIRKEGERLSALIRLEHTTLEQLELMTDYIFDYCQMFKIDVYMPMYEQFHLLYENLLGSYKTTSDYYTNISEKGVFNVEISN